MRTRLTEALDIKAPILLAPMGSASGGLLASAVSASGGLGLIGGGYGDASYLEKEFAVATENVGCGFITWALHQNIRALDIALEFKPVAVMLSFGDPSPFAERIKKAGAKLICQVQSLRDVRDAIGAGADIVVAQNSEAGGHGLSSRGTFSFVPEVVDLVYKTAPETPVAAAGGVVDGRGLAAALMLGADGVLIGTRFWTSQEAGASEGAKKRALQATGDQVVRTSVYDIVKQRNWPSSFTGSYIQNSFIDRWAGSEDLLSASLQKEAASLDSALGEQNYDLLGIPVGQGIGLLHDISPARKILDEIVSSASDIIAAYYNNIASAGH